MGWLDKLRMKSPSMSAWHRVSDNVAELCKGMIAKDGGLGIFRFAHLLEVMTELEQVREVISLGSGQGYHEAALATLYPETQFDAYDLYPPEVVASPQNCRFHTVDLSQIGVQAPRADLVYSIECLEHIKEDRPAFAMAAGLVKPGGWLYLQLPFANEREQADPQLQQQEWQMFQHYRPGYDSKRLQQWALEEGLEIQWCRSVFWFPLQTMYYCGLERLGESALLDHWRILLEFARMDIRHELAASRSEAVGIKLLARRPIS